MKKQLQLSFLLLSFFMIQVVSAQVKTISLSNEFDKIIVSPHIEVEFVQGDSPKIEVMDIIEPIEKFNFEIVNKTLQVYLEGAKTVTKHKKYKHNDWKMKVPIYKNTVAKVKITYNHVEVFSIRGEEKVTFETPLDQGKCTMRIYGESEVLVKEAKIDDFRITIYGESHLVIDSGKIERQRITAYGSSKVKSNAESKDAKVIAYGDGTYQVKAKDRLKITSYGESDFLYKGNPELKKGIVIGESTINRVSE